MRGAAFTLQAMRSRLNRVTALAMGHAQIRVSGRGCRSHRQGHAAAARGSMPGSGCSATAARGVEVDASPAGSDAPGYASVAAWTDGSRVNGSNRTSARASLLRGADEIGFAVMRSLLRTLVQLATSPSAPTAAARQHRGWRQRDTADASHRRSASGSTTALDAIGVTTLSVSPRDAPNHCAHACSGTGSRTAPSRPANTRRTSATRRATRCCHRLACSNR